MKQWKRKDGAYKVGKEVSGTVSQCKPQSGQAKDIKNANALRPTAQGYAKIKGAVSG